MNIIPVKRVGQGTETTLLSTFVFWALAVLGPKRLQDLPQEHPRTTPGFYFYRFFTDFKVTAKKTVGKKTINMPLLAIIYLCHSCRACSPKFNLKPYRSFLRAFSFCFPGNRSLDSLTTIWFSQRKIMQLYHSRPHSQVYFQIPWIWWVLSNLFQVYKKQRSKEQELQQYGPPGRPNLAAMASHGVGSQ